MKKRLLIFTVILTLLCGTLVAYQALGDSRRGGTVTISREEYDRLAQYAKLDEVLQYIQAYYYQEPDTDAMMDMAVQGLLDAFAAKAGEVFDNDRVLLSTAEDREN